VTVNLVVSSAYTRSFCEFIREPWGTISRRQNWT